MIMMIVIILILEGSGGATGGMGVNTPPLYGKFGNSGSFKNVIKILG